MFKGRSPISYILISVLVFAAGVVLWKTFDSVPTSAEPDQSGWTSTAWGPLGPADRNLIIQVRLAGLWEMPTGQQMLERGSSQAVRDVGDKLQSEHMALDQLTRDTSTALGVLLPNQPTPEKQDWMDQISAAGGSNFDWLAVNLLRQAHGSVLPTIIDVRVGTRNALVRAFADKAAQYVTRHIGYLESTGLVNFDRLDQPVTPPRAAVTSTGQYEYVPVVLVSIISLVILSGVSAILIGLLVKRRQHPAHSRGKPTNEK